MGIKLFKNSREVGENARELVGFAWMSHFEPSKCFATLHLLEKINKTIYLKNNTYISPINYPYVGHYAESA